MRPSDLDILIEKSLRGEISPEEARMLEAAAESDPELRERRAAAESDAELLSAFETRVLTEVDRSRLRRIRRPLLLRRRLAILGWIGILVLCVVTFLQEIGIGGRVVIGLMGGFVVLRLVEAFRDERDFAREAARLAEGSGDFLGRYRAWLEAEWKRWRSASFGDFVGAFVMLLFASFGNHPKVALGIALLLLVSGLYHRRMVVAPLARELAELREG